MNKTKLVFKANNGAAGPYQYLGVKKYCGPQKVATLVFNTRAIIAPNDYIVYAYQQKPDIAAWSNEIDYNGFTNYPEKIIGNAAWAQVKQALQRSNSLQQLEF